MKKVKKQEFNEETINKKEEGTSFIKKHKLTIIIAIIISGIGVGSYCYSYNQAKNSNVKYKEDAIETFANSNDYQIQNDQEDYSTNDSITTTPEEIPETKPLEEQTETNDNKNSNTIVETTNKKITDDNEEVITTSNEVTTFYQEIEAIRNQVGDDFANAFQSEADITNFVEFVKGFNPFNKKTSSIKTIEEFDYIINNYYASCVKYNVTPTLNNILSDNEGMNNLLKESELLASNLISANNDDYSIPNEYYTFFGENIVDGKNSKIDYNNKTNAPYIYILLKQYEQYRNVSNMIEARKNQKTYDLNINNSTEFACPDSIDNFIISDIQYGTISTYQNILDFIQEECNKQSVGRN